jgi:pimeloyl-ACP methyl ester carboxylesterase
MSAFAAVYRLARFATLTLTLAAASAVTLAAAPAKPAQLLHGYPLQLAKEAASKPLCESDQTRIFVTFAGGTECIAYYSTSGVPRSSTTILFFQGDNPVETYDYEAQRTTEIQLFMRNMQLHAERSGMRIIFVARPGVYGSSGNHGRRRTPYEMQVMNSAVTAIKARHGLTELVLVGQSGGSTVSAALLSLGRTDVSCAILGSGGQNVTGNSMRKAAEKGQKLTAARIQAVLFDPTARTATITRQASRRVFVLGDPTDTVTPFDLQQEYAVKLQQQGHHAATIEIKATGDKMHGAVRAALPAAVLCGRGAPDTQIRAAVGVTPSVPVAVTAAGQQPLLATAGSRVSPFPTSPSGQLQPIRMSASPGQRQ